MKHDDSLYLRHILDAIKRIESYLEGVTETDFLNNPLVQDGVIRQIEIIGEAAKQVSTPIKEKYSQVPWQDIGGMRDKLIHAYFGVDINTVWLTGQKDIPILKREIETILKDITS